MRISRAGQLGAASHDDNQAAVTLFKGDEKGSSVDDFLSTEYCLRVNMLRHCSSVNSLGSALGSASKPKIWALADATCGDPTANPAERATNESKVERRSDDRESCCIHCRVMRSPGLHAFRMQGTVGYNLNTEVSEHVTCLFHRCMSSKSRTVSKKKLACQNLSDCMPAC